MQKVKSYKCPQCGQKFQTLKPWGNHVRTKHPTIIPEGWPDGRYFYYLQTGKDSGHCVVCKNPTQWNEETMKYSRFCDNPKCKEEYREMFKNRMIGKYGKVHLLDDPDQQRKMLAAKHISGEYTFKSDTRWKFPYTGTYELDWIKMMDTFLHWPGSDIMMPSPHTYEYEYINPNDPEHEGKHFYIPDAYIPSLNLEIEIKQNTNMHPKLLAIDKVKEECKDKLMRTLTTVNYIKIVEKQYAPFYDYLELRAQEEPVVESFVNEEKDLIEALESFNNELFEALESFHNELQEIFKGYHDEPVTEAFYDDEHTEPVFILLTKGNRLISKAIQKATKSTFSHTSISFNSKLTPLYSFGSNDPDHPRSPKYTGFIKTDPHSDLWFPKIGETPYSLYVTFVTKNELENMKKRLNYFIENADKMKYSFGGLVRIFFHLKSPKKYRWFCSMFVSEILNAGEKLDKDVSLYKPVSLAQLGDIQFLANGQDIIKYDSKEVDETLREIRRNYKREMAFEGAITKYDEDFIRKESDNLSNYNHVPMDSSTLTMWKGGSLSHCKVGPAYKGELYFDKNKVVGLFDVEHRENCNWLQQFEIAKDYRGRGLSHQLLERAIRFFNVTNLAVDIENEVAIHLFLEHGFTEYTRDSDKLYMWKK